MPTDYLPGRDDELAMWGANASAKLSADHAAFGISEAMADEVASLLAAYRQRLAASNDEMSRGPFATRMKNDAKRAFVDYVRVVVRQVQGTAAVTDGQRFLLGITVRKFRAGSAPAPGTPFGFAVTLDPLGPLTLRWRCANPRGTRGTIYQVSRRADGGETLYLGGVGEKSFTDTSVPPGTHVATYDVQAVRSRSAGESASFTVTFAAGGNPLLARRFRAAA